MYQPPKYAEKFLHWILKEELQEEILGDLEEKFYERLGKKSLLRAKLNYWCQTLHYLRPFAMKSPFVDQFKNTIMLRNYFKIAFRNLAKHKAFSFIHILGLAIGTAACLLILQYVQFERSYDTFHKQAENIYRVPIEYSGGFGTFPKTAANHPGLGPAMVADFPEVGQYTRIFNPSNMGFNLVLSYTNSAGKRIFTTELLF